MSCNNSNINYDLIKELPNLINLSCNNTAITDEHIKDLLDPYKGKSTRRETQPALLESLLRSLSRSPEKLDRVNEIIRELENTPEGQELFPKGFDEIWQPIWKARKQIKSG